MLIRELSGEECHRVLSRSRSARLACARENQPYVVPVFLAYDAASESLYGFTTPGQKVDWMQANPLVCIEVDEIAAFDQWVSVIASGRYEELPGESVGMRTSAPERPRLVDAAIATGPADSHHRLSKNNKEPDAKRERAWQILQTQPMWWEPACLAWTSRAHRESGKPFTPVFYRIKIDQLTGHEATPDDQDGLAGASPPVKGGWGWLRGALSRLLGGGSKETNPSS